MGLGASAPAALPPTLLTPAAAQQTDDDRRRELEALVRVLAFLAPTVRLSLVRADAGLVDLANLGLVDRAHSQLVKEPLEAAGRACARVATLALAPKPRVVTVATHASGRPGPVTIHKQQKSPTVHQSGAILLLRGALRGPPAVRSAALDSASVAFDGLLRVLGDHDCRPCQYRRGVPRRLRDGPRLDGVEGVSRWLEAERAISRDRREISRVDTRSARRRCSILGLRALLEAGAIGDGPTLGHPPSVAQAVNRHLGDETRLRAGLLAGVSTTDARGDLVLHRDFRADVLVDLSWLLRFLGVAGSRPSQRGAADILWCLRSALRAKQRGPQSAAAPARRLALEAVVGFCKDADDEWRSQCHAYGVTSTLVQALDGFDPVERPLVFAALGAIVRDDADAACYVGAALIRAGHGSCDNGSSFKWKGAYASGGADRAFRNVERLLDDDDPHAKPSRRLAAQSPVPSKLESVTYQDPMRKNALLASQRCDSPFTLDDGGAQDLCDTCQAFGTDATKWAAFAKCGALDALAHAAAPATFFKRWDKTSDKASPEHVEAHVRLLMGCTVAFQDWCATLEKSRQPLPCCASHVRLLADGLERLAKPGCHIKSPGHARCFVYTTQSLALLASLARCFLKPTRCVDCVGGEWAQAARSVLRVMCGGAKGPGASTYNDDSQLADYALCTLCLVGACDDGGDSPNRFFDPSDGKGLVDLVANESNVSPDLRDDVRRRLGFGDEAVADLEDIDHQSIELRDVAVLVIAHQVCEWRDSDRGYGVRTRTRPWLTLLSERLDALVSLVRRRRRAARGAARELLLAVAMLPEHAPKVSDAVCPEARDIAVAVKKGPASPALVAEFRDLVASRLDTIAARAAPRLRKKAEEEEVSAAELSRRAAQAAENERELLAMLDSEDTKKKKKKKKKKRAKSPSRIEEVVVEAPAPVIEADESSSSDDEVDLSRLAKAEAKPAPAPAPPKKKASPKKKPAPKVPPPPQKPPGWPDDAPPKPKPAAAPKPAAPKPAPAAPPGWPESPPQQKPKPAGAPKPAPPPGWAPPKPTPPPAGPPPGWTTKAPPGLTKPKERDEAASLALARKLQEEEACRASDLAPFLAKLDLTEHAPQLFRRGIDVAKVKALSPQQFIEASGLQARNADKLQRLVRDTCREAGEVLFFDDERHIGFIKPHGSHGERSKNLMYHVSEFERGTVPKKGTRVTYVRGQYNRQPVARVIRVVETRGRASSWARVPSSTTAAVQRLPPALLRDAGLAGRPPANAFPTHASHAPTPLPVGARAAPAPMHALGAPGRGLAPGQATFGRPNPAHQPRPFGAARTYAAAPGAFGAPGPPAAAPPPQVGGSHPNLGGLFGAGGNQAVPPKMPRGSAAALGPPGSRDYLASGSGFGATYSAFGGGGLGLFASAPGFITTSSTPRVVDDAAPAEVRRDEPARTAGRGTT